MLEFNPNVWLKLEIWKSFSNFISIIAFGYLGNYWGINVNLHHNARNVYKIWIQYEKERNKISCPPSFYLHSLGLEIKK